MVFNVTRQNLRTEFYNTGIIEVFEEGLYNISFSTRLSTGVRDTYVMRVYHAIGSGSYTEKRNGSFTPPSQVSPFPSVLSFNILLPANSRIRGAVTVKAGQGFSNATSSTVDYSHNMLSVNRIG